MLGASCVGLGSPVHHKGCTLVIKARAGKHHNAVTPLLGVFLFIISPPPRGGEWASSRSPSTRPSALARARGLGCLARSCISREQILRRLSRDGPGRRAHTRRGGPPIPRDRDTLRSHHTPTGSVHPGRHTRGRGAARPRPRFAGRSPPLFHPPLSVALSASARVRRARSRSRARARAGARAPNGSRRAPAGACFFPIEGLTPSRPRRWRRTRSRSRGAQSPRRQSAGAA